MTWFKQVLTHCNARGKKEAQEEGRAINIPQLKMGGKKDGKKEEKEKVSEVVPNSKEDDEEEEEEDEFEEGMSWTESEWKMHSPICEQK